MECRLCPRECGADRVINVGFCGMKRGVRVARAALHQWEEPCISGTDMSRGSGTVFFSGCTLKCCFCQNYPISAEGLGKEITVEVDPAKLRPVEVPVIRADISKLQADTGWQPEIPLEQTIAETLEYWKQHI